MKRTLPGEVWRIDFGMAAKVRPALVLSDFPKDEELALLVVVPHTTSVRQSKWEVIVPKSFLKPGAFHLQQIQPVPLARFDVKLGMLSEDELKHVRQRMVELLHLVD